MRSCELPAEVPSTPVAYSPADELVQLGFVYRYGMPTGGVA
ncbi:MAG: hypothetical protein ACREAO_03930 [Nitrososphaera sp.]